MDKLLFRIDVELDFLVKIELFSYKIIRKEVINMKIGFIGLGKMGSGLAKNLIRSGHQVYLYDLSKKAIERVKVIGGIEVNSPFEMAGQIEMLFTSLPLPNNLVDLLIKKDKLLSKMNPGAILIDVSTIDPKTARLIADEAALYNVDFLACPLGKGPAQAEEGIEPIFVGGNRNVYLKTKDILEQIGGKITYLGDVEQSTAFKLISNMVGMANLAVISEAIHLAKKAGIDEQQFKELMHDTGGDSAQLHIRAPLILNNSFEAMFSVKLAEKDVRLGVEMAKLLNFPAKFSELTLQHLQKADNLNFGNEDAASIYKTFPLVENKQMNENRNPTTSTSF
ncbi:NAD(P)-dependent oxidoreductase [Fervidibacillus albus]|uniref:NAD(P)-dependent oxidoreductase n=1 Tax=Fervidibacillus albus TaxID=2980026 RepID=A0A9E8LSX1_9BACI|nr:NAD(P)-dependent oxidoreductase [Fervidibacillus albus]WAA09013.1 NAD(P)-dependent oxidoreductase [Fervidibacillus albus]